MENLDKRLEKIELTMRSIENIKTAEPSAYFYIRLKARMEAKLQNNKISIPWFAKPQYAFSILGCLLILNAFTFFGLKNRFSKITEPAYTSYSSYISDTQ